MSISKIFLPVIAIIFAVGVSYFNPSGVKAQDNNTGINKQMQSEVKSPVNKSGTLQDLQSKLVDQYGVDGFRFVKDGELKEVKNQKTLSAKELSQTSGLDEYTIIIILAAIGAIAVILFIFK